MNKSRQGETGFGVGFFLGALLGAVGVYVSVTPEGKRLKERFITEFEGNKKAMEAVSTEESTVVTDIRSMIAKIKQAINPQTTSIHTKPAAAAGKSDKKKHYFKAKS